MAVEVALEDDVFFADLNRQISLLIDEDEDDYPTSHFPSISPQGYRGSMIHYPAMMPSQYMYQESCRREMSKGTGVFIPQSSQPRRKYKHGKRSATPSYAAKSNNNKQLVHSRGRSNSASHSNLSPAAYATNVHRWSIN